MKKRGIVITISLLIVLTVNVILFARYNIHQRLMETILSRSILSTQTGINYSVIIFGLQWILILIIAMYFYFRRLAKRRQERIKIEISKRSITKTASQTDFDVLYSLLKKEKSLSVRTIATIFKIHTDIALEWAKILESNDMVTIEYPAFGYPEVMLIEEKKKEGSNEKDNKKNEKSSDEKQPAEKKDDSKAAIIQNETVAQKEEPKKPKDTIKNTSTAVSKVQSTEKTTPHTQREPKKGSLGSLVDTSLSINSSVVPQTRAHKTKKSTTKRGKRHATASKKKQ